MSEYKYRFDGVEVGFSPDVKQYSDLLAELYELRMDKSISNVEKTKKLQLILRDD